MPALLWVAVVTFYMIYWFDKTARKFGSSFDCRARGVQRSRLTRVFTLLCGRRAVLRLYRAPPKFDEGREFSPSNASIQCLGVAVAMILGLTHAFRCTSAVVALYLTKLARKAIYIHTLIAIWVYGASTTTAAAAMTLEASPFAFVVSILLSSRLSSFLVPSVLLQALRPSSIRIRSKAKIRTM